MMALRNMFDMVATEGTLRQLLRQLTFAKTLQDIMRVNVENSLTVTSAGVYNGANATTTIQGAGLHPQYWGVASWNTVDARYEFGEQQVANYIQSKERWTFS